MKSYVNLVLFLFVVLLLYGCGGGGTGGGIAPAVPTSTPTPVPTGGPAAPTATHTPAAAPTATHTPVAAPTATHTPVVAPTATHTPVPGAPVIYSVTDSDGNNLSPVNTLSVISFTLNGINFGASASSVTVTFVDMNNTVYTAVITTCQNTFITGNINLPAGKYVIRVKTPSGTTGQDVYYYKGEGDVEIIAG